MYDANQFQSALNSLNKRKGMIRENKMIKEEMGIEEWSTDDEDAEVHLMENPNLIPLVPKDYALDETIYKLNKIGNYGLNSESRKEISIGDIAKFMIETFGVPTMEQIEKYVHGFGFGNYDDFRNEIAIIKTGAKLLGIKIPGSVSWEPKDEY